MPLKLLLTGRPGCGKTTVVQRIVAGLPLAAGGFYTQELRGSNSTRLGFEIVALDGRRAVLAHIDLPGPPRVGKYGVDLAALDRLAVASVTDAVTQGKIIIIDEIGPMEIASTNFRNAVLAALDSPRSVLATIVQRSIPFTDALKRRPGIQLIEVTPINREALPKRILDRLQGRPNA
jgi:nucleoside-triphosphatase